MIFKTVLPYLQKGTNVMTTENRELTLKARNTLAGKWPLAIGTFFVYGLIEGVAGQVGLTIIIGGAMQLGLSIFTLNLVRGKKAELSQIFDGFSNFANALVAYLLSALFVLLWSLLLIVPGIIAAIAYSQTFYILADNKDLSGQDAIKKSKEMMQGHKMKYFMLSLRFFGWFILSIFTLFIGLLWLIPYATVSFAHFYEDIKQQA